MDKAQQQRHELSNLNPSTTTTTTSTSTSTSTPGDGASRFSFRLSQISQSDIQVANGFRPVSPLSGSSTPIPRESMTTPIPLLRTPQPTSSRNSLIKSFSFGLGSSEDDSGTAASVEHPFNPNSSRFESSPGPASTYDANTPYHARISRISFSYPRRPTSTASSSVSPAHPYALYQQTTFEEEPEEDGRPLSSTSIPVGFPPRSANFRRRVGADGEELGVIGPDGHLEQLPPYTRYPDAGPAGPKQPPPAIATNGRPDGEVVSSSSISTTVPSPVTPVHPAHPDAAFVATGEPQPQQSSNPAGSTSRLPVTPNLPQSESTRTLRSSSSSLAEEKARKAPGGWRKRRNRKMICGTVPLWAVLLFAFLCIFLAVIAGGVIGGMLSQQRERNKL
jgi:hypothetical protein